MTTHTYPTTSPWNPPTKNTPHHQIRPTRQENQTSCTKHWTNYRKKHGTKLPQTITMCYKKNPSLRNKLARTRLVQDLHPNPTPTGSTKEVFQRCSNKCLTCPHVNPRNYFQSTTFGTVHAIHGKYNCRSKHIVYLITCKKCGKQYVGQTTRSLHVRIQQMKAEIKRNVTRESIYHFRKNEHTQRDIQIHIIDHVGPHLPTSTAEDQLKLRETHWINCLTAITPLGLNYITTDTTKRTL